MMNVWGINSVWCMIPFIWSSNPGTTNQYEKIRIGIAWGRGWVERKGHEGPILGDENIVYLDVNICQTVNLRFMHFTAYKL